MRETIRHHVKIGVDQIKLSMSGEQITETRDAQDCYFSEEETMACVDEAHRLGVRLCAHARARDSVTMCVRCGVDVVYHASWTDDEGRAQSLHIIGDSSDSIRHGPFGNAQRPSDGCSGPQLAGRNHI